MGSSRSVYRITHHASARGQQVINTSHWRTIQDTGASVTDADLQDLTASLGLRWRNAFVSELQNDYTYIFTSATELVSWTPITPTPPPPKPNKRLTYGQQSEDSAGTGTAGGQVGVGLPLTVAAVIHHRTGFAGRSYRGRLKLGPLLRTDTVADDLTAAKVNAFLVAITTYRADYASIIGSLFAWELVIHSPTLNFKQAQGTGSRYASTRWSFHEVIPTLGTQRSRKLGVGD